MLESGRRMVGGQHSNGERLQARSVPRYIINLRAAAIDAFKNEMRRRSCGGRRWRRADHAIAVQVLLETALDRLQRGARSRHGVECNRDEIAVAVGVPDRILIGNFVSIALNTVSGTSAALQS